MGCGFGVPTLQFPRTLFLLRETLAPASAGAFFNPLPRPRYKLPSKS
jgi:hypothetical protein